MALHSAPFLVLMLEVVALQHMCHGSSSHSLKIIFFAVLDSNQTLPQFVIQGYVDSQIFACYDSKSTKIQPRVSWVEKLGKEYPQYWQALTDVARSFDEQFRVSLARPMNPLHEIKDLHTLQGFGSCEFQKNRSKGVFWMEDAYNGETVYAFHSPNNPYIDNCFDLLEKCLSYGNETLMRTETPVVTVSSRTEVEEGMEMYVCRIHSFYPREIDASWMRDGEVWEDETFRGSVAPNADGTYHYWISIQIDPKERGRYRCHVEHDGLQEPLNLELKEPSLSLNWDDSVPESNLGLITGCVVAGLVVACVIVGSLIFLRSHSFSLGRVQGSTAI